MSAARHSWKALWNGGWQCYNCDILLKTSRDSGHARGCLFNVADADGAVTRNLNKRELDAWLKEHRCKAKEE